MATKLSSFFIELTLDACLNAFWRKKALLSFLKQHDIPNEFKVESFEGYKREFLDNLFSKIYKQSNADQIFLSLANSITLYTTFLDLENCEDSEEKIKKAKLSVKKLKIELMKIDGYNENIEKKKIREKREEEKNKNIETSKQNFSILCDKLLELNNRIGEQSAGYDFEIWFYDLACYFELQSRKPYKDNKGRQIDGAITVEGTDYIVETKLTKDKVPTSEIDSFIRKISTKSENTLGIMLSINGYEQGAIDNASFGKTQLLLLDGSHLFNFIINQNLTLEELILRVKRHAAQTGESYLPYNKFTM